MNHEDANKRNKITSVRVLVCAGKETIMIRSVEIKGLRGIQEGKLDSLTPLTVLVGPNGCGKSTVLDALFLGGSPIPADAFRRLTQSKNGLKQSARWIVYKAEEGGEAEIDVVTSQDAKRTVNITMLPYTFESAASESAANIQASISQNANNASEQNVIFANVSVNGSGSYTPNRYSLKGASAIGIVEWDQERTQIPLYKLYTTVIERGRKAEATAMISSVVPACQGVEILTEEDKPIVHLLFENGSVPVALAGDGIQSLLRLILELASRPNGIVLLEEPEVHQHPGAIRQSARAIWAAVRRDIQVILSTHSLELIDALLSEVQTQEELDKMSVYRLQLRDGCLQSYRMPGSEVAFARTQIEDDLR